MQPRTYISPSDYLHLESTSEHKHEYVEGHLLAMAGASVAHNRITANLVTLLNTVLGPADCSAVASDLRVQVAEHYFYPDVVVECGEPDLTETEPPSLLNPVMLIEVTSPSTSDRDRGLKLHAYTTLTTLREYWIVDSNRPAITQYLRSEGVWVLQAVLGLDAVARCAALSMDLPLRDVYRRVL